MTSRDKAQPILQIIQYQQQSPLKASPAFVSKNERFTFKGNSLPGPGAYQFSSDNFKLQKYHFPKETGLKPQIRKQHMWIWGSNRTSYIDNKVQSMTGPGSYNYLDIVVQKNHHHTNWGKSERFNSRKRNSGSPGPGSYANIQKQTIKNQKNGFNSVFLSKSPRSQMANLHSQTSMSNLPKNNLEDLVQNFNPEASTQQKFLQKSNYEDKKNFNSKIKSNTSVFASKIPRFNLHTNSTNIGPGSYEASNINIQKSQEKLPKIISVQSQDRTKKVKSKKKQIIPPGPGSYDEKIKTIQKQLQVNKNKNSTLERQQRFIEKLQNQPGPGHYMQQKYQWMHTYNAANKTNTLLGMQTANNAKNKHSFGISERSHAQLQTKANPFGNYNVDIYNIQYRLKKKQEHLQKLAIMEVTLPAFNTKNKK